jgi:hypothetical protein
VGKIYIIMASIAAKKVAEEVLETIGRGEMPSVNKIGPKHGYKKTTSHAGRIQQTKTFQKVIEGSGRPLLIRLNEERDRAIALMKKKIGKAKYRDLNDTADKLTKQIQILTGGRTGNEPIIYTWKKPPLKP